MLRKDLAFVMVLAALVCTTSSAFAAMVSFSPGSTTVPEGANFSVNLNISGLGNGAAPSLGTYDIDVGFDASIIDFTGASFGSGLGTSFELVTPLASAVNLLEISFESPLTLDAIQPASFQLATLNFTALMLGTSSLDLNINAIGDAFGNPLPTSAQGGSVSVVPLPGAVWLLGSALAGLFAFSRRKSGLLR